MTNTYKISEVAKLTGLSVPTLRYYEDLGILKPRRQSNNYRMYSDKDLHWIEFINRAKATGMTLSTIIDYSKLREQGNDTVNERIEILEQQEQLLYMEREKIQAHIDFLQNKKQHYTKYLVYNRN